jgi:hypothetical protein
LYSFSNSFVPNLMHEDTLNGVTPPPPPDNMVSYPSSSLNLPYIYILYTHCFCIRTEFVASEYALGGGIFLQIREHLYSCCKGDKTCFFHKEYLPNDKLQKF